MLNFCYVLVTNYRNWKNVKKCDIIYVDVDFCICPIKTGGKNMTEFFYENEERLMQIWKEVMGDEGKIKQEITPENLDVYKFLISMSIYYKLGMNVNMWEQIRDCAMFLDSGLKNRVFFEKSDIRQGTVDSLYFRNFMKEASRDTKFLGVYQTYFNRAA